MPASTSSLGSVSPGVLSSKTLPDKCAVCDAPASYRHFGSEYVCKSCAAFFRRTVALKNVYKCRTNGQCSLRTGRPSAACKACRFRKCVSAGMSTRAVIASPPTKAAHTPLDRLVHARKAVYINRIRESLELCAKLKVDRPAPFSRATLRGMDVTIRAEFLVLCDFIKQCGVLEVNDDATSICPRLASSFLSTWVVFEWLWATIRNLGYYSRRIFYNNESYLDLTEAAASEFYGTDPEVFDPQDAGRVVVSFSLEALENSRTLARAHLDEVEIAVVTLILFVRAVKDRPCGDDSIRVGPLLDVVFRNLLEHYRQTYEDFALRLDVIVHMADEIERIRRLFDEHSTILRLYGRRSMLSKIEEGESQKNLPSKPNERCDGPRCEL